MLEDQSIISSENFIIGSIIKDYPMTRKISNDYNLNIDHFESATAREVWSVADFLYSSGKPIDAASLIDKIEERNNSNSSKLDMKAVSSIIVDSLNITTSTKNVSNHIETIIRKNLNKFLLK